jgi:hypothetical protein
MSRQRAPPPGRADRLKAVAQVCAGSGVIVDVEQHAETPILELIESVRCLACGSVYAKPARGGTVAANPGCPGCGYLGWLPLALPLKRTRSRRRSGGETLRLLGS